MTEVELEPVFDAVVANVVFLSIANWETALRTCVGALRPGGQLVFSIEHPCFDKVSGHGSGSGKFDVGRNLAEQEEWRGPASP